MMLDRSKRTVNPQVPGSSPGRGANKIKELGLISHVFVPFISEIRAVKVPL